MRFAITVWIGSALLLTGCHRTGSLVQRVPPGAAAKVSPLAHDANAWKAGEKLFLQECSPCHGENREGTISAPPLAQAEVMMAAPGTLYWILRNGSLAV